MSRSPGYRREGAPEEGEIHRSDTRRSTRASLMFRGRDSLTFLVRAVLLGLVVIAGTPVLPAQRPNILWIIVEDLSPHFSCYGESTIETPGVDRLAREGVKFQNAFVTSPVCSPSRSALITGMYQTTIGAHNHQSSRGPHRIHLPENVPLVPALFRDAGYHVTSGGKTDYNFVWDESVYAGETWAPGASERPFFAQVHLRGGKWRDDEENRRMMRESLSRNASPDEVVLPPYYPDHPMLRQDWADYLNSVLYTDAEVVRIMEQLRDAGAAHDTYVFLIADHGMSHVRGKQFLYDEGIHIPFIVWGPGLPSGTVRHDLIEHIDMAATSLALAGIPIPPHMHARNLFAEGRPPRDAVFAARDRCDETVDRIRSVRTSRYKYIRNFHPERPYLQPSSYRDSKEVIQVIRRLHEEGRLDPAQALMTADTRPPEELYDLASDPWEIRNLSGGERHREVLEDLRGRLDRWIEETGDRGEIPEPVDVYEAEMAPYLAEKEPEQRGKIRANMEVMKRWAEMGK